MKKSFRSRNRRGISKKKNLSKKLNNNNISSEINFGCLQEPEMLSDFLLAKNENNFFGRELYIELFQSLKKQSYHDELKNLSEGTFSSYKKERIGITNKNKKSEINI